MRQVRGILRLKLAGGSGVAASTVLSTANRDQASWLNWPLPDELTYAVPEATLFGEVGNRWGHRRQEAPD